MLRLYAFTIPLLALFSCPTSYPDRIYIDPPEANLRVDEEIGFKAIPLTSKPYGPVIWNIADTTIARITSDTVGDTIVVRAYKPGKTELYARHRTLRDSSRIIVAQ